MKGRTRVWGVAAHVLACIAIAAVAGVGVAQPAGRPDTIARVKRSIVAVGTFAPERTPAFAFRGTGFAVGSGSTIVTNSHVLPTELDTEHREVLAIIVPSATNETGQLREVTRAAVDPGSDLALLKLPGEPLPPLALHDADDVREGQEVLLTGFPLGNVLGPFAATHRGMISAVTPIAIPQARAADLNPSLIRRLSSGTFRVLQLDATAYPGNSGSPIYDPLTGEVLGIVNMVFVKGTKEAAITQPSGITYALPASRVKALLRSQ